VLASGVGVPTPVVGQQIISGLAAMVVLPAVVLRRATLPAPVSGPYTGRIRWHAWVRLVLPLLLGFAVAGLVEVLFADAVVWMRSVALLGGVGPGVFLVQQVFAVVTAGIGVLMVRRSRRSTFAPPLAVLVPAHNEAHLITATVAAVDRSAAAYEGAVRLYVVDNASTDTTREVAEGAIARCRTLRGVVLSCTEPGKARALNFGLARIEEEFVVRIDADTEVGERCLDLALRHLADPTVGAVGGIPLPARLETWIDKVRLVEVLLRHGFFQVSMMGYDGILGLPGMFVAYRRKALDAVGPIVEGMNGEDTDICLRMAGAGYRNVVETRALYRSETPASLSHLREQRTRWFRSIYHVTAHNRHAVFGRHSVAGAVVLPFQLVSAARRAMLAPVLLFAVLILTVFREDFPGLNWQPVVATVVGLPMLVAVAVCLAHRQFRALLYVPAYLLFRVARSYLTLGALLSLVIRPTGVGSGSPRGR
jgi:GT2 family glycosyltransferase